jgi:hypothetical protein
MFISTPDKVTFTAVSYVSNSIPECGQPYMVYHSNGTLHQAFARGNGAVKEKAKIESSQKAIDP